MKSNQQIKSYPDQKMQHETLEQVLSEKVEMKDAPVTAAQMCPCQQGVSEEKFASDHTGRPASYYQSVPPPSP